jgi:hypothetical protein
VSVFSVGISGNSNRTAFSSVNLCEIYVKLCEIMWNYVKLCEIVWDYVKLCEIMWDYVKLCEIMWDYVRFCEIRQNRFFRCRFWQCLLKVLSPGILRCVGRWRSTRHFGGKCRLYLQVQRISQARNQHKLGEHVASIFWVEIFFDPEYGSDMFLRNSGWLSTAYMTSYSRR